MLRVPSVVTASLALLLTMAVAPPAALADRFRGGPGGPVVATPRRFAPHPHPPASRPVVPHTRFHHHVVRPGVPHRHFARPFVRPFVFSAPVVVYTYTPPPVISYPPAQYAAPT